jgi:bifunctional non-homologous end joining protein LigD
MADKQAEEVMVEVGGRTMRISNLGKVMYPTTGTTKGEVLNYYARVAPVLLPHLAHRAVTRIRWPHGTGDMQFFEKNLPSGAPGWLHSVAVPSTGSRGGGDTIRYPIIDGLADLTYFANLASLELHVHQWTVGRNGRPKNPNRMVIDLDPGSPAGLRECCEVALLVRDKLEERGLSAAPVTSGSKGLHMYAALPGKLNTDEVRDQAQEIAQELTAEHPKLVVWKMTKSLRGGKVFLDWSQNTGAKTTISPYSLRGRDRPYVAAPRTWQEIEDGADEGLGQLEMDDVLSRVADDGDIFGDLLGGP